MDVREIRQKSGLSQSEFAKKFNISKSTLANWEQGLRKPPDYIPLMIEKIISQEEMISNLKDKINKENL